MRGNCNGERRYRFVIRHAVRRRGIGANNSLESDTVRAAHVASGPQMRVISCRVAKGRVPIILELIDHGDGITALVVGIGCGVPRVLEDDLKRESDISFIDGVHAVHHAKDVLVCLVSAAVGLHIIEISLSCQLDNLERREHCWRDSGRRARHELIGVQRDLFAQRVCTTSHDV